LDFMLSRAEGLVRFLSLPRCMILILFRLLKIALL
jgi:hypothetical protein